MSDDAAYGPSISADGARVFFYARGRTDGCHVLQGDVYVRDLRTAQTRLISRQSVPGDAPGDHESWGPIAATGGRYVAFQSFAANFDPADVNGLTDAFRADADGALAHPAFAACASASGGGPRPVFPTSTGPVVVGTSGGSRPPRRRPALALVARRQRLGAAVVLRVRVWREALPRAR